MELKPGYKLTEIGTVPDDWQVVPIGTLGKFKNGLNKGSEAFGHGHPFINLMDVFGVSSIEPSESFGLVETNSADQAAYDLNRGDVLFIRSSVKPSGVGLTAVVEQDLPHTVYSGFLIRFRDGDILDIGFKRHCFYDGGFRNQVIAASSVSANTNINQDNLKKLLLAVPSTKVEQRAIAAALSDVDTLLSKLDQLITKKRDLKQAAMQQLLNGQTRLPGFSGEWEVKSMKSLGRTYGGLTGKSKADFASGTSPYIPFMNVMTGPTINRDWLEYVDVSPNESQNLAERGDLFFNGSSETPEEVGFCSVLLDEIPGLYLNSFCFGFRFHSEVDMDGLFFAYWFRCKEGRKVMSVLAQGATRYNIAKSAFLKLSLAIPTLEEQTAIATVLSDMDAELSTLEARCEKTRALKQGMMQELLTGRTRLV